jgi:hypothetical protein
MAYAKKQTSVQVDDNAILYALTADTSGGAKTAIALPGPGWFKVSIQITAKTGTSPTLDVVISDSDSSGGTYVPRGSFPQITGTFGPNGDGTGIYEFAVKFDQAWAKVTGTIGGSSTPGFTWACYLSPIKL